MARTINRPGHRGVTLPDFTACSWADRATRDLASRTGIDVCPEGGAAWAALADLRKSGFVRAADKVVVFNTGTGLKYR